MHPPSVDEKYRVGLLGMSAGAGASTGVSAEGRRGGARKALVRSPLETAAATADAPSSGGGPPRLAEMAAWDK